MPTQFRLTTNGFDWVRHRRPKTAAKPHLTFGLGNRLPSFAVADRTYADCGFMNGLDGHDVRFATRQRRNMKMTAVRELRTPSVATSGKKTQPLRDETVVPARESTAAKSGGTLRRVTAIVEIQGQMKEMTFLANNLKWSVRTVTEICRNHRGIETFFGELKQTCRIHDFIGYGENAERWQA